ncbi:peptidylprolyl isomerase [Candidatus Roizmanbacteria bacterium]|nr:peptidylprolyl isomerase [Candidatus Roizmanbacteria bacterium]
MDKDSDQVAVGKSKAFSTIVLVTLIVAALFLVIKSAGQSNKQTNNTIVPITKSLTMKKPPALQIDKTKHYQAVLHTGKGDITIELDASTTPLTVNNFVSLAKANFYNNTIFHRVIKGFMIQGGDPTGTGTGGPGYSFADEPFAGDYTRGTVAMANAGPNTNGSQFFIMQKDQPLPKNYVIFGKVTKGMDAVDKIAASEMTTSSSGEDSKPIKPTAIATVEITVTP